MLRKYNVVKSKVNSTHKKFKATSVENLPDSVDLSQYIPSIFDQGSLGSCTANAGVRLRTYFDYRMTGSYTELSRLFLYFQERLDEGTVNQDAGAEIADLMKVMKDVGVCPESYWPYDISKYAIIPPSSAYNNATYKIDEYHMIDNFTDLRAALAQGLPVVLGVAVYDSFESMDASLSGMIPVPNLAKEKCLGGHAILAVGYEKMSDGKFYIKFLNSWGSSWGQGGYGKISQDFFEAGFCFDMWTGSVSGFNPIPTDPSTVDINVALNALKDLGCTDSPEVWINLINYIKANPSQFQTSPLSALNYLDLLMKKFYVGLLNK